MMRAVWYDRQGPANEVLVCGELPTPEPGNYEVRVRLEAAGVNPSDAGRRRGPAPALEYPRVVTCSDGAGVVDRVGSMVPESWVGRRVWLYNGQRNGRWMGTAAEFIALNVDLVMPLPERVSFAEGATLGIPGMTAGAVGHYAVQLARWAGATVIATVSSEAKAERARAGGANHVINYRNQDVAARVRDITGGEGVDHVVDVDFGGNLAATLCCVRANGSIAIYASNGDRTPRLPVGELMQRNISLYPMSLPGTPHPARKRAQSDMANWIASGQRILSVAAQFPLYEAAAAHEAVERGDKVGTVVIDCAR
jgi:NADPH:quinone reductase